MILTKEQIEELNKASEPVIRWVRANCHPHCLVMIDGESVEVVEGLAYSPNLFPEHE